MSKKELVLRAIRGETVERIPVGFWLHYVTQEEKELGLDNPAVLEKRDLRVSFSILSF